jgi:nitroreductase
MDQETIKTALKEAIYQRRSTRAYTTEHVPEEIVEAILDAGRHAPSGNNLQNTHFYVITNAEKRAELKDIVTNVLANMEEKEGMPPVLLSMIKRAKQGEVDVTYGAPVLIVTTNKKGSMNAAADCSCTLQNMMLTASAHGLGNCWINQFFTFRDAPPLKAFFAGIGVSEDEEIFGSLSIGYTEKLANEPLPRTGNQVTYIR